MPTPNGNCLAMNFLDPLQERQARTGHNNYLCPAVHSGCMPERFGYES